MEGWCSKWEERIIWGVGLVDMGETFELEGGVDV